MGKKNVKFENVVYFQEGPGVRNWQFRDSGIKLINIRNLVDGELCLENTTNYLEIEEVGNKYKHFLLNAGDFVMASSGVTWGKIAEVHEEHLPLCLNTSIIRLVSKDADVLDKWYLYYYIKSPQFRRQIERLITGSAQPNFGPSHLKKVFINLPEICNQREAVEQFSKVEAIINKRQKEMELFDELIKARFVELFGDMTVNPNGWEVVPLGKVCDVRDGTHDSPKYFTEGYPLVTSKNVTSGKIDFSDCNLICEEDYKKINERSKVDFGDILMPMIGTVGKPVIVDMDAEFAIKNVALIKFYKGSQVTNIFVKALLQSDYFDRAVISKIRGGTQKFIALGDIRKLEICLPPMFVQEEFAIFVSQTDKSKVAVQKTLNEAQLLFDSLMQKYFG